MLAALLVAWILFGAFPFSPVEGDETGVINGLHAREHGVSDWRSESYLYPVQPGSYWLILATARVLRTEFFTAFALGSLVASVTFAIAAALLICRVLRTKFVWTFVAFVLLAQEISAGAAYANTSTFGGTAVLAGLLCFGDGSAISRALGAGVLIGLGGWLRFDALLIAPTVIVLAGTNAKRLKNVTVAAGAALTFLIGAFLVGGVPLANIWNTYAARDTVIGYRVLVRSFPLLLSYGGLMLSVLGMALLIRRRAWGLILLVAVGVLPSLVVHGRVMTTTKYLYYTVPFLLLPAIAAAQFAIERVSDVLRPSSLLLATLSLAVATEWLAAVRTTPEELRVTPVLDAARLLAWRAHGHDNALVIGSGNAFMNDDGLRLRGGLLFAPLVWRRAKAGVLAGREAISSALRTQSDVMIIVTSMNAFHCARDLLWSAGYRHVPLTRAVPEAYGGIEQWTKPGHRCDVALFVHDAHEHELFARFLDLAYTHETALLLNDRGPFLARDLWPINSRWPRPSSTPLGFMNLFTRP